MFKKLIITGMLALSFSAIANSMSQDPKNTGLTIPSDISESRQHYEKQSRVSYSEKTQVAEADLPDTAENPKAPIVPIKKKPRPGPRATSTKRTGAMRF